MVNKVHGILDTATFCYLDRSIEDVDLSAATYYNFKLLIMLTTILRDVVRAVKQLLCPHKMRGIQDLTM
jgi:hypothetical protein